MAMVVAMAALARVAAGVAEVIVMAASEGDDGDDGGERGGGDAGGDGGGSGGKGGGDGICGAHGDEGDHRDFFGSDGATVEMGAAKAVAVTAVAVSHGGAGSRVAHGHSDGLSPSCASRRASSQVTPKCRDVWVLHQAKDLTSHQHSGMKTPPGATIFFSSVYYQLVCV